MTEKVIRILSMDGAGVRGIATARVLEEMEKSTGKRIHELFDVIVGTSTGGVIALYMTIPSKDGTIEEAKNLRNRLSRVYPEIYAAFWRHWGFIKKSLFVIFAILTCLLTIPIILIYMKLWKVKYSNYGVDKITERYFEKGTTLRDAVTSVGVVVTDLLYFQPILLNSGRAKLYNCDYRHNASIKRIMRSIIATPFYFSAVEFQDKRRNIPKPRRSISYLTNEEPEYLRKKIIFEDGTTTANNPGYIAFKYARSYLRIIGEAVEDYRFELVSIGTGTETGTHDDPSRKHKSWLRATGSYAATLRRFLWGDVFRITMKSYEVHSRIVAKIGNEGPGSNYFRIQFKVTKHQLTHQDDYSRKNLESLVESVEEYMYQNSTKEAYSEHFQGIINLLKKEDVIRPPKINKQMECRQDPVQCDEPERQPHIRMDLKGHVGITL